MYRTNTGIYILPNIEGITLESIKYVITKSKIKDNSESFAETPAIKIGTGKFVELVVDSQRFLFEVDSYTDFSQDSIVRYFTVAFNVAKGLIRDKLLVIINILSKSDWPEIFSNSKFTNLPKFLSNNKKFGRVSFINGVEHMVYWTLVFPLNVTKESSMEALVYSRLVEQAHESGYDINHLSVSKIDNLYCVSYDIGDNSGCMNFDLEELSKLELKTLVFGKDAPPWLSM